MLDEDQRDRAGEAIAEILVEFGGGDFGARA